MSQIKITDFFECYDIGLEKFDITFSVDEMTCTINKSDRPLSIFALVGMLPRNHSLRNSILQLAYHGDNYTLAVVLRVFIEHFVKAMYIYARVSKSQDDGVGQDYFSLEGDFEKIKFASSLIRKENILGRSIDKSVFDFVNDLEILESAKSRKEAERNSSVFKINKMLDFILSEHIDVLPPPDVLLSLYSDYESFSSVVHALPTSNSIPDYIENKLDYFLMITSVFSLTVNFFVYETLARENDSYREVASYCNCKLIEYVNSID